MAAPVHTCERPVAHVTRELGDGLRYVAVKVIRFRCTHCPKTILGRWEEYLFHVDTPLPTEPYELIEGICEPCHKALMD